MSTENLHTYEAMFLFPQTMTTNLKAAVDHLDELLRRAEAQVLSLCKWDERRLAYDVAGNKRGVYFLAYFKAGPDRIIGLERDCNLSEHILRAMFLRADHLTDEEIQAADGRSTLEDEIKLRGEEAEKAAKAAKADNAEKAESAEPAPAAPETPATTEEAPAAGG